MMSTSSFPGVDRERLAQPPRRGFETGVAAFLGVTETSVGPSPQRLTRWSQFVERFGKPLVEGYLGVAVQGFFENGGRSCYVCPMAGDDEPAFRDALASLEDLNSVDLVCAPDVVRSGARAAFQQQAILDHCELAGDRFAILDSLQSQAADDETRIEALLDQRRGLLGTSGALYAPWIAIPGNKAGDVSRWIPPCGHIAGVYARSDHQMGVHKAPANEPLHGVLDLETQLSDLQQGRLHPAGVNCLRAFPGRGIRVWGARTLSRDPNWVHINVRRTFLAVVRWVEFHLAALSFEPHTDELWSRIERELTVYFSHLFRQGALKGDSPQEAFYVKCDAETNPPDQRDQGRIVTEVGLAPAVGNEFIVIEIVQSQGNVSISQ